MIKEAIKALEQEPCEDTISRQAVLEVIEREQFKSDTISEIKKLPPVTPTHIDLDGLKSDMKALNCGYPYGLDYLLDCLKKRLGITIVGAEMEGK